MVASGHISDGQDADVSRYLNRGGDSWASEINCDSQKQRSDPVYNDLEKKKEKKKRRVESQLCFYSKIPENTAERPLASKSAVGNTMAIVGYWKFV